MTRQFRDRLIAMVGNILEHYDHALFGLLAPFLAPLFFEEKDPLTALILTYGMLPFGILMRPLGSLFFGWIGDLFGRTRALFFSLLGMAAVTFAMGCLPTHVEVGYLAPLLLALGRILQNFFAAGESVGGAIYVLERTDEKKKNLMSAIYDSSSIAGILFASALVTLFSYLGVIFEMWRVLFWIGGGVAILGVIFRLKAQEGVEYIDAKKRKNESFLKIIKAHWRALIAIIFVSGFSHMTFFLAFTLMNGYIPLVTSLSKTEVMSTNTLLLLIDMLLLPFFGQLASKIGREKVMLTALILAICTAIPLFCCLKGANLMIVVMIRLVIVSFGVAFSATYHSWSQERVPPIARYTVLSLGYAIGSQFIGAPTAALSLWLFKKTDWLGAPAVYLIVIAALAGYFIRKSMKDRYRIIDISI